MLTISKRTYSTYLYFYDFVEPAKVRYKKQKPERLKIRLISFYLSNINIQWKKFLIVDIKTASNNAGQKEARFNLLKNTEPFN